MAKEFYDFIFKLKKKDKIKSTEKMKMNNCHCMEDEIGCEDYRCDCYEQGKTDEREIWIEERNRMAKLLFGKGIKKW